MRCIFMCIPSYDENKIPCGGVMTVWRVPYIYLVGSRVPQSAARQVWREFG